MKYIKIILLLFVTASVVFLIVKETKSPEKAQKATDNLKTSIPFCDKLEFCGKKQPNHHLEIYYFMTTQRCVSCHKIETFTRQLLRKEFRQKLDNGSISFKMVNIQKPENKHFINDFGLYTKSVVIIEKKDNKIINWKNLGKIWKLLGNKSKFEAYEKREIEAYLKAAEKVSTL